MSSACWQCSQKKPCSVCGERLSAEAFPESQWADSTRASRLSTLRCTACHCCATCRQVKDARAFDQKAKDCIECQRQSDTCRCDACQKILAWDEFDKDMLGNAKWHKRHAVCLRCAERGFSPRDTTSYNCQGCGEKGHLKFNRDHLKNFKRHGTLGMLQCVDCIARLRGLNKILQEKKAWRCTCKQGDHDFSNEKCTLYPRKAGEKRWAGKNLGVTEADLIFRARMGNRQRK